MKQIFTCLILFMCLCYGAQAQQAEATHVWEFNAPVVNKKVEGWEIINYNSPNTTNGILNLTAATNVGYPNFEYKVPAGVTINPEESKQVVIRLKNGTSSRRCRFYWVKDGVQTRYDFLVSVQDTDFKEYTIDLSHDSRWSGKIDGIRFQIPMPVPSNSHNTIVSIDYVKILKAPAAPAPMPNMLPAPFGVNLAGAGFANEDYQYPHAEELDYFKEKGQNLMRISFKWERMQPELNGPLDSRNLNDLRNIVWAARKRGIWVLLDLHNYGRRTVNGVNTVIGNPGVSIADATDIWVKLAQEFKDFGNIYAYGLMNEPYGMTQHTPWVNIAQGMIDGIRTIDTHTPIMVGGESYSSAARWKTESDNLRSLVDPSDNLIYEAHVYFDNDASGTYVRNFDNEGATLETGVNRLKPFVEWLQQYNLRGFIGEYGVPDDDPRWLPILDRTMQYMKENHLNGTYWAAGSRWGTYKLSVHPNNDLTDRPQMAVLEKYTYADAPLPLPAITSPLAANFNVANQVIYKLKATNNPSSYTVTGLPAGLTFSSSTNLISGTIPAGNHTIQVSATNEHGTGAVSELVLRGMQLTLPGIVEAEFYNDGGNQVGYFDRTIGNAGNAAYRHDDVDIRVADTPYNFAVTRLATGEWLKYTVDVQQEASYRVSMRYATPATNSSGVLKLKLNGNDLSGDIALTPTANNNSWNTVVFEIPVISAGQHVLELYVVNEGFDFDRLEFNINTAPAAPSNFTAAAFGSKQVNLNWEAVNGASSYTVKRAESENGTYEVIVQNLTMPRYADVAVTPETTYFYIVNGANMVGEGATSAKASATTTAFAIPGAVTSLFGIAGDGRVSLTWAELPDVSHYRIIRSTVSGNGFEEIATTAGARYTDTTAANGTTYYYMVSAENALGEGSYSAEFAATPETGRFSYWTFDETNGTTATDSWSNLEATLSSGASFVSGKFKNALELNGQAESYVMLPQGVASSLNDFTISAWVKPTENVNWARLFDFGSNANNTTSYMYLTPRNGINNTVRYAVRNGSAPEQLINSSVVLAPNEWVHLAVTQAGTVGILYINGTEVGRNNNITIKPSQLGNTPQNYIGKSQFASDPTFKGLIDELKIYGKALTSEEVVELSNPLLNQVISFNNIPQKEIDASYFSLSATASSGLPVSYSSSNPAVATVVNSIVQLHGAGTTTITASQAGNNSYAPAAAVARVLTVVKKAQTIAFESIPEKTLGNPEFVITATASSGLPVVFSSSNTAVATVEHNLIFIRGIGTAVITATQAGDGFYAEAQVAQTLVVMPDTEAPSAPTALTLKKAVQHQVELSWEASTDNIGVIGYEVYRNGDKLTSALVTGTNFLADRPIGKHVYEFTVKAVDAAGNYSLASNNVLFYNGEMKNGVMETIQNLANASQGISASEEMIAYPNPSAGNLQVQVNTVEDGAVTILIYNTAGILVKQIYDVKRGPYEKELHLRDLPAGLYYLKVEVGSFLRSKPILIK
ncbi:cellulase family glycosylhydrolase [Pontibacter sp. 13R65]|uniref:cellulase family glycosylhydrolase n=1 Tax=Pontibacter sp. 13R65 TaxID=3127458 RepID=UPI00301E0253